METNQETTQVNTVLTSEHVTIMALASLLCIVLAVFIVSLARVSMTEDTLAAKVAEDRGAVAAYCLYKASKTDTAVCAILASKEGVK